MNSDSSLYLDEQHSESLGADVLSIALIGPDEDRRKVAADALAGCQGGEIREFSSYPASLDDVPKLLEQYYDVIIIDLDTQPEYALELVESLCANCQATVMVYSEKTDSELLVRCMRAGAREFLTLPFAQNTVAEALVRATARRPATRPAKKAGGRLLAFLGAKGGDGVTTLACNFAVSLAQESSQSTLLIDLDLPLGDAALNLGVSAEYSAINALQNAGRLDSSFLSKLLVKHSSGVSVLAAPGKFPQFEASDEAIDKLISVARQDFDNVVIDIGSRLDLMGTTLFKDGATIYLVIQTGIAGLRNSNRLISQYFATEVPKLEIVLNRYQPRSLGVAEDQITKALTRPVQWKIPNDYAAVRRMQHTAIPLALEDSPISRLIRQMARSACGLPAIQEKGSGFSLKKISRSISSKMSTSDDSPTLAQLSLTSDPDSAGTAPAAAQPGATQFGVARPVESRPDATQPEAAAKIPVGSVEAPAAGAAVAAEAQAAIAPADAADRTDLAEATTAGVAESEGTPSTPSEPETRTYQGATYVKGADAQWHLKQTQAGEANAGLPAIEWPASAPIFYGMELSANELNATASVPGAFIYTPAVGEVLEVGTHTLSVTFTPADTGDTAVQAAVSLTVTKATPIIAWSTPAPIAYGAALGAIQLNAMASVPGAFVYTPAAGELLPAGENVLSVVFTPTDAEGHTTAHATVSITVDQATPAIIWPIPASISYGTVLSVAQLNATASAPGRFVYTPSAGVVLPAGVQTLSATFTPSDDAGYTTAKAAVPLTVTRATPLITWPKPADLVSGTALGDAQLNATALVQGSFFYSPAEGEVLGAGAHALSVTFIPADTEGYTTVQATVSLTVSKARTVAMWPMPPATSDDAVLRAARSNVEPQPASAKAAPAEAKRQAAHVKPAHKKAAGKAPAKAVVKAPAKAHIEAAEEAPTGVWVKVPATPPIETPENALVKSALPKSPIDVGPGLDLMGSAVFEDGTTIYLVLQPGSAGLPTSNRLVSQFFAAGGPKPEIVINRYDPGAPGVPEGQTSTALTRPSYSPISRLIGQMARPNSELRDAPEKGAGFSLKGFGRKLWARISTTEKPPSITQLGSPAGQDDDGTPLGATQSDDTAKVAGTLLTPGMKTQFTPTDTADLADAKRGGAQSVNYPLRRSEPETRTYQGATYVKGADGQWHLQKPQGSEVNREAPAIARPMPAPIGLSAALRSSGLESEPEPPPVKAGPAQLAPEAKPKAKKVTAKAPAKRRVKAAAKPSSKATAKRRGKSAAKPTANAPAKRLGKAAQKSPAKSTAKRPGKAVTKASAKAPVKRLVKAVAKSPAPAPKTASARKKQVSFQISKPAKTVKSAKSAVNQPAPEAVVNQAAAEPAKES